MFAQLLRPQAHAKLGAAGEPAGKRDDCGPQRPQGPIVLARLLSAEVTFLQVRSEPNALGLRQSFYARLRDQLQGALVNIFAHDAAPAGSAARSASRPRYRRDFTVDSGTLSMPAISSIWNSS